MTTNYDTLFNMSIRDVSSLHRTTEIMISRYITVKTEDAFLPRVQKN